MELNTPELFELTVRNLSCCQFKYAHKIRILEVELFDYERVNFNQFANLELLIVTGNYWQFITNSFLQKFSRLKEVHFQAFTFLNRETLAFTYRPNDPKRYLFGFDTEMNIESNDEFRWSNVGAETDMTKFLLKNYDKTANRIYYKFRIDYNELTRNTVPKNFFEKLSEFSGVFVKDRIDDEAKLINFLEQTKTNQLSIENSPLTSTFFDRMVSRCSFIQKLDLKDFNIMSDNYEFMFKMENLIQITLYHKISFNFLVRIFEGCKYLSEVTFTIDDSNYATFCSRYVDLFSRVQSGDEFLDCEEDFRSKEAFMNFLKEMKSKMKCVDGFVDLSSVIFTMHEDKARDFMIDLMVKKLFENETFILSKEILDKFY